MKKVLIFITIVLLITNACEKDCGSCNCEQKNSANFSYMGSNYNVNLPSIPEDTINFYKNIEHFLVEQGNNAPYWDVKFKQNPKICGEISGKLFDSSNDIFTGVSYRYDCIYGMGSFFDSETASSKQYSIYNLQAPRITLTLDNRADLGESSFVYNLFTEYLRINYNTPFVFNGHEVTVTHNERDGQTKLRYIVGTFNKTKNDTIYH